jgi:hypothetical protein
MTYTHNSSIFIALINSLRDVWRGSPNALEHLLRLASWKKKPGATYDWVSFSARVGRDISHGSRLSPRVLALLKDRGKQDLEPEIRRASLRAIALGWNDDAEAFAFLKERAIGDADVSVRAAVLEIIAQRWAGYIAPMEFVRERAVNDPSAEVRVAALQAICWAVDLEEVAFWQDRAINDRAPEVRAAILEELAMYWAKSDIRVLAFVMKRAVSDPQPEVRQAAEKAVAATRVDGLPH